MALEGSFSILKEYFPNKTPECIMIVMEEGYFLKDIHEGTGDNPIKLEQHDLTIMRYRARFNGDINYYIIDCDGYVDLGLSHEFVFDMLKSEYDKYHGKKRLDELFENVHRI